jgi:hypothetical protein
MPSHWVVVTPNLIEYLIIPINSCSGPEISNLIADRSVVSSTLAYVWDACHQVLFMSRRLVLPFVPGDEIPNQELLSFFLVLFYVMEKWYLIEYIA